MDTISPIMEYNQKKVKVEKNRTNLIIREAAKVGIAQPLEARYFISYVVTR